jgi:hypothetical protein
MNDNQGEIKVTGSRDFSTGAHRDPNTDKGRYDLISPLFLRRLAVHTQKGGKARGDRNWEAGMPLSVVIDSAIRHLYAFLEGDRSEDHLAAGAWNIMVGIHCGELIMRGVLPSELYDLPDYTEQPDVGHCKEHGDYPCKGDGCPGCVKEMNEYLEQLAPRPANLSGVDPCGNCINSDEGSPVPFSDECGTCSRAGNWKGLKHTDSERLTQDDTQTNLEEIEDVIYF